MSEVFDASIEKSSVTSLTTKEITKNLTKCGSKNDETIHQSSKIHKKMNKQRRKTIATCVQRDALPTKLINKPTTNVSSTVANALKSMLPKQKKKKKNDGFMDKNIECGF